MFISYAGKDLQKIKPLVDGFDATVGLEYYLFDTTKTPAEHTREDILNHIKLADAFLLFHSVNSKKINYVQHEIGAAIVQDKPVIIAKLSRSKPDGMLKDFNYFDFSSKKKALSEMGRLTTFVSQKIVERQQAFNPTQSNNGINWPLLLLVVGLLICLIIVWSKTSQSNVAAISMKS
jgi:hypothetical protein